jgi:hypothetical protein
MTRLVKSSFTVRLEPMFTASRQHLLTNVRDRSVKTPVIA